MMEEYKPILIGQDDPKKVFIEYGEYLKILKFAKAGATDGSRGVLLGRRDGDRIYILKALEALYCGGEGIESPAFSPDSWGRITAEIKENYSELVLLGQFSTHSPVNPQRMDYIMQDRFLNTGSNLLFVFDPTNNQEKMYVYDNREFVFLNGFYIFDKFEKPINLSFRDAVVRPLSREYEIRMRIFDDIKKKIKRQNHFYAVLAFIIILLTVYSILRSFDIEKRTENFPDSEAVEWRRE